MRRRGIAATVVGAALLVGCTSQAQEPPGVTQTGTPRPTPSSTPSPTVASETQDLSDPALGIVFDDVPVLTGDAAAVHNLVATYKLEYWRMMTTNTVSPAFAVIASPEVLDVMTRIATSNSGDQADIGGTFHTSIREVEVEGDTARVVTCDVYADVTFADVNGPTTPEGAGFGETFLLTNTLTRLPDGRWVIGPSERAGTC